MRIFLDTSVLLAACLSETGGSRELFHFGRNREWTLLTSPWVQREMKINLAAKPRKAIDAWSQLRPMLTIESDELTFDWPINFEASKDKPVLFTALACADVLLTLDRRDFRDLLGTTVYGLRVLTPGDFLQIEGRAPR